MSFALESLLWLVVATLSMLLLKRWIHRHAQGIGLLLTGNADGAFLIYSALLFPGTFVHELAHYVAAFFLDVRVRRFSIVPAKQPRGLMRLGFVEIERTDTLREALIGFAPLLAGTVIILLIAPRELPTLQGDVSLTVELGNLLASLPRALGAPDFWLSLYFIFAVSNGMLPSESDRQAWKPIFIWFAAIAALLYLSGAINDVPESIDRGIASSVRWIVRAFLLAVIVDLLFVPLIFFAEKLLESIKQQHVL